MRGILLAAAISMTPALAVAQQAADDSITFTLSRAQADYVERLLRKETIAEAGPVYFAMQSQITEQFSRKAAALSNQFEKQVRDKLAAEAAKATEDKAAKEAKPPEAKVETGAPAAPETKE